MTKKLPRSDPKGMWNIVHDWYNLFSFAIHEWTAKIFSSKCYPANQGYGKILSCSFALKWQSHTCLLRHHQKFDPAKKLKHFLDLSFV